MGTITLKIKNKKKLNHFLAFIKDLDFVEVLQDSQSAKQKTKHVEEENSDDFFALAGIWENRDIDADDLRAKAWPKRN